MKRHASADRTTSGHRRALRSRAGAVARPSGRTGSAELRRPEVAQLARRLTSVELVEHLAELVAEAAELRSVDLGQALELLRAGGRQEDVLTPPVLRIDPSPHKA